MAREKVEHLLDPIIVVGQPRSGSTILTRLLNADSTVFLVNDFYVLQKIDAEGLWDPLSSKDAFRVAQWVYRIIEIRCTQEVGKTLEQPIHLSLENLGSLKHFVCASWPVGLLWSDVLRRVFEYAAALAGASRWGWNTPQDHQHLERIFQSYPTAKVICQLRGPAAVLASYKNVQGWWHDPRRYNPVVLAYAWKKAGRNAQRWQLEKPEQFLFLRYEDLVAETKNVSQHLARFLQLEGLPSSLEGFGDNSSLRGTHPFKKVTATEMWIAERICGQTATTLGFEKPKGASPRLADVGELGGITLRSMDLVVREYLFDADKRQRLINLFFKR